MHKTKAGERRKALKKDVRELEKEVKALARTRKMEPAQRVRQEEVDRLKAEAEGLKARVRLEDLHIWQMKKEKSTKKGSKTYTYWMASWRDGSKVRNVHLGSCMKMDSEAARQKAQKRKAEAMAIKV
jgi:regulator of replication initiation timing